MHGDEKSVQTFWAKKSQGKRALGNLSIDGKNSNSLLCYAIPEESNYQSHCNENLEPCKSSATAWNR
jgi:hypothetical protein